MVQWEKKMPISFLPPRDGHWLGTRSKVLLTQPQQSLPLYLLLMFLNRHYDYQFLTLVEDYISYDWNFGSVFFMSINRVVLYFGHYLLI